MKTGLYSILFITYIFSSSCKSNLSSKNDAKHYGLTIVCSDKIATSDKRIYPIEIINLCKPIDIIVEGKYFIPTPVTLLRTQENRPPHEEGLEILTGNETNFNSHRNRVDAFFMKGKGKEVSKPMYINNTESYNPNQSLSLYLASLGKKEKVYYFSKKPKADSINKERLYNDIDTLKSAISNYLIENPGYEIVVIYDVPEVAVIDTPKTAEINQLPVPVSKVIKPVRGNEKPRVPPKKVELNLSSLELAYARYNGEVLRKKPCGQGTMFFLEDHTISSHDSRVAKKGDKIVGYWVNGEISHGNWFDKNGNEKGKILNGTSGECR